ncbi:MAG: heat-shock protein, partial [Gammaproteobacteria bacterium]|nr:heat-shock protein [Gammaproteobacteria bacterium]
MTLTRTRRLALLWLMALALVACDLLGPEYIETREVTVGPTLAKCYGVGLQSCMVVDGEFFYD